MPPVAMKIPCKEIAIIVDRVDGVVIYTNRKIEFLRGDFIS